MILKSLRCFVRGHGSTLRVTVNGKRMFRCESCGGDVPQVQRDGRFIGLPPACESMKAQPKTSRDALRKVK